MGEIEQETRTGMPRVISRQQWEAHYHRAHRADRRARRIIAAGGYGIILSIVAILLFLAYQSWPLSWGASVKEWFTFPVSTGSPRILLTGVDPYLEVFYTLNDRGAITFFRISDGKPIRQVQLPLKGKEKLLSASRGSLGREAFAAGSDSGRVYTGEIRMKPNYAGEQRVIEARVIQEPPWKVSTVADSLPNHVELMVYRKNEDLYEFWAWTNHQGELWLRIYDPDLEEAYLHNLTDFLEGHRISAMTMSYNGENLIIGTVEGEIVWLDISDYEDIEPKERWKALNSPIAAVEYLLGDQTVVIGGAGGEVETWFPVRTPSNVLKFQRIHQYRSHNAAVTQIYVSSRNRSFLTIDAEGQAGLHYSTTGRTQLAFQPSHSRIQAAAFSPKVNAIVAVNAENAFTLFRLENPHPETTVKTLFGKVWYEGYPQPAFVWQSTGGSDEFEPKLSLIPLIFGTFKGTLYAMIFSVPIALLSAIYVSQFAPRKLARVIKPTVEIMAALPSVVVGFLAGLYFSPLIEDYLSSALLFFFLLPLVFGLALGVWRQVPESYREKLPPTGAIWVALFILVLTLILSLWLGHPVERLFFEGNFQQWLFTRLGETYETRNSLVVGFALGFAVVPIIFTVAEDALSNVPDSLTSAALALGASRWQTVRKVVLPAASGGIFAAMMLGLGRAVGETMIVLMATGNTPIIDLSPFNGFRAMSACIAVEIPEAPVGGTLYRVLFLTALLLFIFTFLINTLSSFIGERLRQKYARF
ncbi:MAG: ABC transporter permease subunit [Calditrichaeota bacterium]|nr:MAG: ABC transporter permease subunit [Calditrichota bacterium]